MLWIYLQPPHFPVDELRLDIDCTECGTWVEIDAVNIVGTLRPGNFYIAARNYTNLPASIKIIRNTLDLSQYFYIGKGQRCSRWSKIKPL